jgi:endonuclease-8
MPPIPALRVSGRRAEIPSATASARSQALETRIVARSASGSLRAASVSAPIATSLPPPSFASASPPALVSPKPSSRSAGRVARKIPNPIATRLAPICSATPRAFGSTLSRRTMPPSLPTPPELHQLVYPLGGQVDAVRPGWSVRDDCLVAEGDTILRLARRFEATLLGEEVTASAPNPRGKAGGVERLSGRVLEDVWAHGKHLVLGFGEVSLHSHLGMSGGWHFYPPRSRWRRPRSSAWAVLSGGGWDAVQFGGPTLQLGPTARVRRNPQLTRLGPDVLAADFDPEAAIAAMRADPTRGLGDALLDQHLVAGIGNIFKSEACYAARVDPWRPIGDLSDEELRKVLVAAREQMLSAVERGDRHRFRIYKRRQSVCPSCRGPVSSRGQGDANRTTYWCPRCQG